MKNACSGKWSYFAITQCLERRDGLGDRNEGSWLSGEGFCHEHVLRQEALDLTCARLTMILSSSDSSSIPRIAMMFSRSLVTLQDLLSASSNCVVLVADVLRIEDPRC